MNQADVYRQFRKRIQAWVSSDEGKSSRWAQLILLAPDLLHLMCRLSVDPDVSLRHRAQLGAAIAYFISPINLVPEFIVGPVGYLDDIALAAFVLNDLFKDTPRSVVDKHWAGQGDVLAVVRGVLHQVDDILGGGVWGKFRKIILGISKYARSARGR